MIKINKVLAYLKRDGLTGTRKKIRSYLYEQLILKGKIERSNYAYCCYHAAVLASKLGHDRMSVIEFGCAGGAGLLQLESICYKVSAITGVEIDIFGFDTGDGLPEPKDYKDLPYHWQKGFFKMKKDVLEPKLQKSNIIYGNVEETIDSFIKKYNPSVIGCVFHDFDYYSSTKASFQLFKENESRFLPRSFHYFDDIIGSEIELYNSWTGERLAINEFNDENDLRKFDMCFHLLAKKNVQCWYHQIRILHMFTHPLYCQFISSDNQQIDI